VLKQRPNQKPISAVCSLLENVLGNEGSVEMYGFISCIAEMNCVECHI